MKRWFVISCAGLLLASCGRTGVESVRPESGLPVNTGDDSSRTAASGPAVRTRIAPTPEEDGPVETRLAQLWDLANTLYVNSDYAGAVAAYDSIASMGYESAKLWYNLGNARFKEGAIGMAIADYNRALRLAPSDPDIRYNLAVANGYTKDRIEPVPEFFLSAWAGKMRSLFSSDTWGMLALVFLAAMLALLAVYLLAEKKSVRKTGFYGALIAAVMLLLAAGFASAERRAFLDTSEGIVAAASVSVKSSPDKTGRDLFILHEGTKIRVTARLGEWAEVAVADGNKGWLRYSALEMIRPGESRNRNR